MPQVIADRYHLMELLGRGGMGAVWRARDETLHREVAVKEVTLPPGLDEEQRRRLYARTLREARSAARLDHPGIVTVHDVVEEDGRPWIVMRLVRAPTLGQVIDKEGPLAPARAAAIGAQLLEALGAAHAAGVVHRDVKPANVLLPGDRAVLTDFGIASVAGDETLTQAGAILGSPAYLAPEQARQAVATPASDLWSLGATLYAAVEGRPPYRRPDLWSVMAAILADEPDPPLLAGPLRPVLAGLLRKDPVQRMKPDEAARLLAEIVRTARQTDWAPPGAAVRPPGAARNLTLPPMPAPPTVETPPPVAGSGPRWPIIVPAAILAVALVITVGVFLIFLSDPGDRDQGPPVVGTSAPPQAVSGYEEYRGGGFAASIPKGWTREEAGREVTFKDPVGTNSRGIVVDQLTNPIGGAANGLAQAAQDFKTEYKDYKQLSFRENIPYQGGSAAELEFTFTIKGIAGHARVRVFPYNGGLYMATMASATSVWAASVPYFDTFLKTFRRP